METFKGVCCMFVIAFVCILLCRISPAIDNRVPSRDRILAPLDDASRSMEQTRAERWKGVNGKTHHGTGAIR